MSLNEKKIIEFNSDIFSSGKKTRKKREQPPKIKPIISPSITKNKLMKQFRDKQNKSELDESLNYLESLAKIKPDETEIETKLSDTLTPYEPQPEPIYGCLKNGTKPTFKEIYKNNSDPNKIPVFKITDDVAPPPEPEKKVIENEPKITENTVKITKNKKYTLGKSKLFKKIGILIKDKQTRKNIMNAQKELKSIPILEIKNRLKKKGLIKSGSTAPSDLLRAMYENSVMAGDIMNTNKDVLLHNFENE
uniref:Uncharacterized protein n=1 Tax=viral metagenome TaxID=1070528 RepID=A0A6C0H5I9_9ZZZZ